jgi:hypothetical protein
MTLALAVVTAPLLKHFGTYTGGVSGLRLKQPESPIGGVANDQWIYLLSLALALVIFSQPQTYRAVALVALCLR